MIGLTPLALLLGLAVGAGAADREAAGTAARLLAAGDDRGAIAIDRELAARGGPLHLLGRGDIGGAAAAEQRAAVDWAGRLAASGDPNHALAVLRSVTDPSQLAQARTMRAAILLAAARQAQAASQPEAALSRLDELRDSGGPAALLGEAATLRPGYDIAAAAWLAAQHHAVVAVALLDQVRSQRPTPPEAAQAAAALPDTLLAAGREDIAAHYYPEALTFLQRLRGEYPGSRAAGSAARILAGALTVTGTLVDRAGTPIAGPVRLGSHFRQTPQGYLTNGPFYYARADTNGDFTFDDVGPGGPYVLEVDRGGGWTTLIDPGSGNAATSLSATPLTPIDLGFVILPA